jgi:polyhydroxyalkanoate synthesis repressor PhaR
MLRRGTIVSRGRERADKIMASSANRTGAKRSSASNQETGEAGSPAPITIKKYANRRLYNTATSSYVTLDHLCQMVKDGEDFVVYDAKTREDITRSVLTQIIVEEENKGQNLLPIGFLRKLISYYGDNLQMVVPRYLDHAMNTFAENQDQTRSRMQEALGGVFPFGQFEDMSKQNMAMFERAMNAFTSPTSPDRGSRPAPPEPAEDANAARETSPTNDALSAMQEQLNSLQQQLRTLSTGNPDDKS